MGGRRKQRVFLRPAPSLRQVTFRPLAFLPQSPWAIGVTEKEIVVASVNNSEVATTFPLLGPDKEARFEQERRASSNRGAKTRRAAFVDPVAQRLIIASRRTVATYPFPSNPFPDHPVFALESQPGDLATIGEPYSCTLTTTAPNSVAQLVRGPEGATLQDNQLLWTPKLTDIGDAEFKVKLTSGPAAHEESWSVGVYHKELDLPFAVLGLDLDESTDARAIAWGVDFADVPADKAIDPQKQSHIALIDVKSRKVIAHRIVPMPIKDAELTSSGVFVMPVKHEQPGFDGPKGMQVIRLSVDDLSTQGQSMLSPGRLTCLADKFLATNTEDTCTRYELPSLNEVESSNRAKIHFFDSGIIFGRVADGWLIEGVLWDNAVEKPRMLFAPLGYELRKGGDPQPTNPFREVMRGYQLYSLTKDDSDSVYWNQNWHFPLSPFIPASLRFNEQMHTTLEMYDLNTKKIVRGVPLVGPSHRPSRYRAIKLADHRPEAPSNFKTTADDIFIVRQGVVTVIPMASTGDPLPTPFRIEPIQSTFTLPPNRAEKVRYIAKNAKSFKLLSPQLGYDRGAELQSTTGEFSLSVADHIPQLVQENAAAARRDNFPNETTDQQRFKAHIRKAKASTSASSARVPPASPSASKSRCKPTAPISNPSACAITTSSSFPKRRTCKTFRLILMNRWRASPLPETTPSNPAPAPRPQLKSPAAATYSHKWRKAAIAAPGATLLDDAKREVQSLNRQFEAQLAAPANANQQPRQWADASGKKLSATLVELSETTVTLADANGNRLNIPLDRLSAEDRAYLDQHPPTASAAPPQPAAAPAADRTAACLRQLGAALTAHAARRGSMPPAPCSTTAASRCSVGESCSSVTSVTNASPTSSATTSPGTRPTTSSSSPSCPPSTTQAAPTPRTAARRWSPSPRKTRSSPPPAR